MKKPSFIFLLLLIGTVSFSVLKYNSLKEIIYSLESDNDELNDRVSKLENENEDLKNISSNYSSEKLISFTSFRAIVISEKATYFPGEIFKGQVAIGRIDSSIIPNEVVINGKKIDSMYLRDNIVELNLPVGDIGENKIEGKFIFLENGHPIEVPIQSYYMVIPKFK